MEKKLRNQILSTFLILVFPLLTFGQGQISGTLLYHDYAPLPGIETILLNSSGQQIASTTTASDGLYQFNNVPNGTYTVTFETNEDGGGVDLSDAFLVLLYTQGLYPLNDIQQLAADVNGNGAVQYSDYVLILVSYLHNGNPFPVGEWVFEDVQYTVGQRDVPITKGSSAGDVNGTYLPEKKIKSSSFAVNNDGESIPAIPGETVTVDMTLQAIQEIAGMHLYFELPEGLILTGIESISEYFNFSLVEDGFKLTWMNEAAKGLAFQEGSPVVTMTLKVDESISQDEELSISLKPESHFIDGQGQLIRSLGINLPTVKVSLPQQPVDIQVYPNPFIQQVTFRYNLTEPGRVKINLYNSTGQLVAQVADEFEEAGNHEVDYNGMSMIPGIYYYTIQQDGAKELLTRGSMIKSK